MANNVKRLNVVSLSFDGCVYHHGYDFKPAVKVEGEEPNLNPFVGERNEDFDRLIEQNQPLIANIATRIKDGNFNDVVMMNGCMRQDSATEMAKMNEYHRGSSCADLPILNREVQQKLAELKPQITDTSFTTDTYLLADTYGILSNYDLADFSTQETLRYLEAEAEMAANAADQAMEDAVNVEKDLATKETFDRYERSIENEKNAAKKKEKIEYVEELHVQNSVYKSKAADLKIKSQKLLAQAIEFREQAKILRNKPYGYSIGANMDRRVSELRDEVRVLRKKADSADFEATVAFQRRQANIGDLLVSNKQKNMWRDKANTLAYDAAVYTRAMHVGSTWQAILIAHEIERLRREAEFMKLGIKYQESLGDKEKALADEALREADQYDHLAREAMVAGNNAASQAMYGLSDSCTEKANGHSAIAEGIYKRADEIRFRMQDTLDRANLLCLGPYAMSLLPTSGSARRAIIDSGNDPNVFQPNVYHHPTCFEDESKLTLLYAQMHRAASENPGKEIVFDFYDGRHDILNGLANFFKNNRDLMPDNLVLNLQQYVGGEIVHIGQVNGNGPIDYNYHHNVRYMVECAGFRFINGYRGDAPKEPTNDCPDVGVMVGFWVSKHLRAFKKQRKFFIDTLDHWEKPYHLGTFDPKIYLGELYQDITDFPDDAHHQPLRFALGRLYKELQADLIEKVRRGMPPKQIEKSAAKELVVMTKNFLDEFKSAPLENRSTVTANFVYQYEKTMHLRNFGKVVAVIFAAIAGMIIGAAIGIGIGFAAGLLTGPGAAVTGLLGMFAGATAGTIAGIAAGSVLVGAGCGLATKFKLFGVRTDEKTKAMQSVASHAKAYVKASAAAEIEDAARHCERSEAISLAR